jgi:simple sugar transport system ATP-binding protein
MNDGTVSRGELARLMCGRELHAPQKPPTTPGAPLLVLDRVETAGGVSLRDVSLTLRAGEILGIAGVSGNGQRELAEVIAGVRKPTNGHVEVVGRTVADLSPKKMQGLRVGRVPEDRLATGMVSGMALFESMAMPFIDTHPFSRRGLLNRKAMRSFATQQIERFDIRTSGPDARTGALSGGNLQKALLARELAREPLILLAAQPTRGIDVGATEFVHRQFLALRQAGGAVLLISEDLEELFALADRIAVMYRGRIVGDLPVGEASVERIGLMMSGTEERAA